MKESKPLSISILANQIREFDSSQLAFFILVHLNLNKDD